MVLRRAAAALATLLTATSGAVLALSSPATAAPSCTYSPQLPRHVSVEQPIVALRTAIAVTGAPSCGRYFDATTHAAHGPDSYFLWWSDGDRTDTQSIYAAAIVPGTYRTVGSDCAAYDADFAPLSCAVEPAATVIKYTGHAVLRLRRVGGRVYFHAWAQRWFPFAGYRGISAPVRIERRTSTGWRTIHSATTDGRRGYQWSYRVASGAHYRAVSAEMPWAFGGISHSFWK